MPRTDAQVALDSVILALREAADDCADAAELASEPTAAAFSDLAVRHRRCADRIAEELRRLGERPSEPDADRRDVRRVARHLKAKVAGHETLALVRDRERTEDDLARAIADARRQAVPDSTEEALAAAAAETARAQRALAEARIRVTSGSPRAPPFAT